MTARGDTRAKMVRSAYELVRRRGFRGTSLVDIVQEGTLPRGSIYFHFPGGKQELAVEVAQLAGLEIETWVRTVAREAQSPGEVISGLFDVFISSLEESSFAQGCAVAALVHETVPTDPEITEACRGALERWQRALGYVLGEWIPDPDRADRLANLVMASLEGGLLLCKARRSTAPLVAIADDLGALADRARAEARENRGRRRAAPRT